MFLFITLLLAYMVIITHNAQKSGKGTHIISILCNFAYTFLPSTPYFFYFIAPNIILCNDFP